MKKENIEKIAEAIMDEYDMSHEVGYFYAEITAGGLEKALIKISSMLVEKKLRGEEDGEA